MDHVNRFHTDESWILVRAEHLMLLLTLIALLVIHARGVNWELFLFAFVAIDVAGYAPGAIAFQRSGGGAIAPIYHHLYNFTHSYLTSACAILLWTLMRGHLEWAMLALPIHLSGDRGMFGNTYKPASLPFEPIAPVQRREAVAPIIHGDKG